MFCPKCRGEFREGFTFCEKCGEVLLDELSTKPVQNTTEFFRRATIENTLERTDSLDTKAALLITFKYIVLCAIIWCSFFSTLMPLAEPLPWGSDILKVLLLNMGVCYSLTALYGLPIHPSNWKRNYYALGDFLLIVTDILCLTACVLRLGDIKLADVAVIALFTTLLLLSSSILAYYHTTKIR